MTEEAIAPQLPRAAREEDVANLRALLAPHILAGSLLPCEVRPQDFLVYGEDELIGAVALRRWSEEVVELGSLVSERPGLGRMLVEAALIQAQLMGVERVVALTGVPGFFEKVGWERFGDGAPPHRQEDPLLAPKRKVCQACDKASTCDQVLLQRVMQ